MLYTQELADKLSKAIENVEIKASEDDKDFLFDVVATTSDTDRDNEVIMVDGRDTKNWEKNPVVLANHRYEIQSIIGKWLKFYTSDGVKRLKGVFSKSNPLGVLAQQLYKEWMLNTVSVGFIPKQRNQEDPKIIEKQELLEVSFVAIPCNPNAVRIDWKLFDEAVAKGLIIKSEEENQEPTPWDKDQPIITPEDVAPVQWNNEVVSEPTVTPCEWCAKILEAMETMQKSIDTLTADVKSLADDNAKLFGEDSNLAKKKALQEANRAMSEALRHFKQL